MKRIVVVEDYHALADMESLICQMEGYEVKTARTGEQGLKLIDSYKPDLVILDLMLPGQLSGSEVLQKIRDGDQDEPKVLVVSALVNQTTAPELEKFKNVQALKKPFKVKELASRVRLMVGSE
ncbi:MAG TPA: response regulator [Candidatus Dormibacteraeota bacterium]|jgi:DNA-binding response OmpR family regulator|nr:response regulator [Candidatus Dormibacteraeota bacterium]